jgi:hypothetical protein
MRHLHELADRAARQRGLTEENGDGAADATVGAGDERGAARQLAGGLVRLAIRGHVVDGGRVQLLLRAGRVGLGLEGRLVALLELLAVGGGSGCGGHGESGAEIGCRLRDLGDHLIAGVLYAMTVLMTSSGGLKLRRLHA